jgi:hypothetical protein
MQTRVGGSTRLVFAAATDMAGAARLTNARR